MSEENDAPREMNAYGSLQLYTKDTDRGYLLYFADDADILAQPVVVKALREAREEMEAAGAIVAFLSGSRWTHLPNSVPACFQDAANRFLRSVGLNAWGGRVSP